MKQHITAIILAGGQSSRMGQDKALLPTGKNQTLLSHVCNVAQESAKVVYVVTPWTERYQNIVPESCELIKENLLDPEAKCNFPLMGFFEGLKQVTTPWILLLACDLPNINSQSIISWYSYLTKAPEKTIAILPRHPKGWEPLCGFYRHDCQLSLQKYLDNGGKSFQQWLKQSLVVELPMHQIPEGEGMEEQHILFNCNTPEDWSKIALLHKS